MLKWLWGILLLAMLAFLAGMQALTWETVGICVAGFVVLTGMIVVIERGGDSL